jgi:hypothetical protein
MATHTTDIVDNKNEITDNQSQLIIIGGRVTNNDTDITNIGTSIATHTTQIGTISADNATTQSQVDIISTDLDTAETDIVNLQADITDIQTNVNALGSDDTKQTNYISTIIPHPSLTTYSDHFNFDVMCYYDFTDPNNLGTDVSGKELHATNTHGVEHSTENTHSAYFKKISHTATAGQYINQRHLNCTAALQYLKQDEYQLMYYDW